MGLLTLPPELLIKTLDGLCIQDIVSAAQVRLFVFPVDSRDSSQLSFDKTCGILRSLVIENKSLLFGAENSYALQLPMGRNPKDVSPETLYDIAAKSATISAGLSAAQEPLKPRSETLYDFAPLGFGWGGDKAPSNLFVRDDLVAFVSGATFCIIKLANDGTIKRGTRKLMAPQPGPQFYVDYQVSDDRCSILIALAASPIPPEQANPEQPVHPDVLAVQEICVTEDRFGETIDHFQTLLPPKSIQFLTIRDPYIAIVADWSLRIIDWRKNLGVAVALIDAEDLDEDGNDPGINSIENITGVVFHPTEPSFIVFEQFDSSRQRSGIFVVNIPSPMWDISTIDVERRVMPSEISLDIFPDSEAGVFGTPRASGFRLLSDSSWVMDLSLIGSRDFEGTEEIEKTVLSHGTVALSNWKLKTEMTEYDTLPRRNRNDLNPFPNPKIAGTDFFGLINLEEFQVMAPKFDNGNGLRHQPCWVRMALPESLRVSAAVPEATDADDIRIEWKGDPCMFDVHTGKLYLGLPEGLLVLQY
ncbi:hypothetical protein SISSUDRAFT_1132279 [Sistotremastrum suecicum HHB10207 ss-3]|uniref:F-box domain-containing protein n=1 Tax=Sistotremastrum suecicum HHB10207 ss-3 TaxID=1314776 RepID=A0A165Z1X1_9AGAM|nr:hypothetical protein SISSUDRAFT_1132279 [Sistotremastrum suecicum HHB10207 ss-3]